MKLQINDNNPGWEQALQAAVTDPRELLAMLSLSPTLLPGAQRYAKAFPLKITRSFINRMQKGRVDDPLLMQVLPIAAEGVIDPHYSNDPLGEQQFNPTPGLLHKYNDRVLFTLIGSCAINCRFCFRRHFPYADNNPGTAGWESAFAYIGNNTAIKEVIFSGGDPLVVSDKILKKFSERLDAFTHVQRLRIHSRIPIVLPERITPSFLTWVEGLKQKPILVLHCNHPQEIDEQVIAALAALKASGITLLNQSVLLKGINDNAQVLAALSEKLFMNGVQPYYLHMLDKVNGAKHFDVPIERAKELYSELQATLSGYLVPKFVYEQAGASSKTNILQTSENFAQV